MDKLLDGAYVHHRLWGSGSRSPGSSSSYSSSVVTSDLCHRNEGLTKFNLVGRWDKNRSPALFSNKERLLLFIKVVTALVLVVKRASQETNKERVEVRGLAKSELW